MIRSQGLLSKLHDGSRAVVAASNSKRLLVRKKPRSFKHLKNHHDNKNINAWTICQLLNLYRVLGSGRSGRSNSTTKCSREDEVKKSSRDAYWPRCFHITRAEPYQYRNIKGTSPSETFGRRIPTKRYLSSTGRYFTDGISRSVPYRTIQPGIDDKPSIC